MSDERRFRVTDRVAAREVAGELVLLDLEDGEFFVARGIGPRVWQLLTEGRSPAAIASLVAARYGNDADGVRRDVESFVSTLVERGFLDAG